MHNPFTLQPDFISPSLNRLRLVALPGIDLPADVAGQLGYDLLSAAALRQMVQPHAAVLGLDEHDPQLLPRFDACLQTAVPHPRAHDIAHQYGRRLGWLLLALKQGDPANRAARPDWQNAHWSWWAQINAIWLGGGLMSGALGQLAAAAAQTIVQSAGFPTFTVQVSPFARDLPLYGLARLLPATATAALLFDFGHTQVKRAIAQVTPIGPTVTLLPACPAPCEAYTYTPWPTDAAAQVHTGMLNLIAATWQTVPDTPPLLLLSIATYLYKGHPYPTQANTGCYSRLQALCPHLATFLQETVSARLGVPLTLRLVHDGEAAAAAYVGWRHTAVITIGTALGIGFPQKLPNAPT